MVTYTSRKAFCNGIPHITNKERVYRLVSNSKRDGLTNSEICKLLGKKPHTISPRLNELENNGFIVKLYEERTNADTGREQNVYVLPQHVDDRRVLSPVTQRSKSIERMLEYIMGKVGRKGGVTIIYGDELYNEIKEILK